MNKQDKEDNTSETAVVIRSPIDPSQPAGIILISHFIYLSRS